MVADKTPLNIKDSELDKVKRFIIAIAPLLVFWYISYSVAGKYLYLVLQNNPAGVALFGAPFWASYYQWCKKPSWLWCTLMIFAWLFMAETLKGEILQHFRT